MNEKNNKFVKWVKDNDVLLKATSLLMALLLWAYVMSTNEKPAKEDIVGVPVLLQGVSDLTDKGLVILAGANNKVNVTVESTRGDVLNLLNDPSLLTGTAELYHITEPGEYELTYLVDPSRYKSDGVSIVDKKPQKLTVVIDRMSTTSVPVTIKLQGEPGDSLKVDEYTASPDAIVVRGPETILRQIKTAEVVYDVTGLTASLQTNVTYRLLDANGEEVTNAHLAPDTPSTTLSLQLQGDSNVPLTVELDDSEYLKASAVEVSIEPAAITMSGDPEVMAELNQINLGTIDLDDVVRNGVIQFKRVILPPNGVSVAKGQQQYATITLSVDGYDWKNIMLDENDLPKNELFVYPNQVMTYRLFGPSDVLQRLRTADLQMELIYDLEELHAGENTLPCQVTMTNKEIYISQSANVKVLVTQEALDNALNPPVDPDTPVDPDATEPTQPVDPAAPTEPAQP
ncbi:MAG: hypothetical protein IKU58_04495 [Clostridia bacterium]|nr:hypothetical protein [Clostridia bacterium]